VAKTPQEQIYPVLCGSSEKISTGADKVSAALGIDIHSAYKLLNIELSHRGLPHNAPPNLQPLIDRRIKDDLERWKKQIHEYVSTIPPEDREGSLSKMRYEEDIASLFDIPKRIARQMLSEELYTYSDDYRRSQELKHNIDEKLSLYDHMIFRVVGVTFKNGRRSRQTILRQIHFHDEPYKLDPTISIKKSEYDGAPAFEVYANDEQVGYIGKDDVARLLDRWDQYAGVSDFEVYGGGGEKKYGMQIKVQFKK